MPYPALLLCLLVAMAGCLPGGFPGTRNSLPTASATLHWAKVDLPRGSYCWNFGDRGECADSPGVATLLKSGFLKPYRTAGGFDAVVTFTSPSQPSGFHVEMQGPNGKLAVVPETAPHTFSVAMIPPAASGVYVYVVTGKWAEGDVSFYLTLDLLPGGA